MADRMGGTHATSTSRKEQRLHRVTGPTSVRPVQDRSLGLDGLRGVALLLVLGYHVNLLGVGWVGVQLFFVLSGFLITKILIQAGSEHPAAEALRRFYIRRGLRILPVFYVYLAMMVVALVALRPADSAAEASRRGWPWAAVYLYNWFSMTRWHQSSYYLDHLWTLAVEEQFYLLWPALVLLLSRRALLGVLVALACGGPLLRLVVAEAWPRFDFAAQGVTAHIVAVCTLSHLDAFAMGALVNLVPARVFLPRHPGLIAALAIALAYLAGAAVNGWGWSSTRPPAAPLVLGYPNTLPAATQFLWGYSVLGLCAAILVGGAAHAGLWNRVLASRPLRFVGRVSYGAYVFHLPLGHLMSPLVFWIHRTTGFGLFASLAVFAPIYVTAVLGAAAISYSLLERPILAWRDRRVPR